MRLRRCRRRHGRKREPFALPLPWKCETISSSFHINGIPDDVISHRLNCFGFVLGSTNCSHLAICKGSSSHQLPSAQVALLPAGGKKEKDTARWIDAHKLERTESKQREPSHILLPPPERGLPPLSEIIKDEAIFRTPPQCYCYYLHPCVYHSSIDYYNISHHNNNNNIRFGHDQTSGGGGERYGGSTIHGKVAQDR